MSNDETPQHESTRPPAPWERDAAEVERAKEERRRQLGYLKPVTGESTGVAPGEAELARGRAASAPAAPPAPREGVIPFAERPKVDGIPRRNRVDHWTPEERAIADVVDLVERMGAHIRLTDAVIHLANARDAVADFVDGKILAGLLVVSPATRLREEVEQRLREAEGGR